MNNEDMICKTCGETMRGCPEYAFCDFCGGGYVEGRGWIEGERYHGMTGLWQAEQAYKKKLSRPGGSNKSKNKRYAGVVVPKKTPEFLGGLRPYSGI